MPRVFSSSLASPTGTACVVCLLLSRTLGPVWLPLVHVRNDKDLAARIKLRTRKPNFRLKRPWPRWAASFPRALHQRCRRPVGSPPPRCKGWAVLETLCKAALEQTDARSFQVKSFFRPLLGPVGVNRPRSRSTPQTSGQRGQSSHGTDPEQSLVPNLDSSTVSRCRAPTGRHASLKGYSSLGSCGLS